MTNEKLFAAIDYLKEMKVPFCLGNNTLLALYRDGKPFEDTWFEHEAIFFVPVKYRNKVLNYPNQAFYNISPTITGLGNLGLDRHGLKMALIFYTEKGKHLVMNIYKDFFFVYDKDTILPFKKIDYEEHKLPIPHNTEKFLSEYYGDWKVKQAVWHWDTAPNVIHAQSIREAIKLC
jgi:hypothetical protein